ncbi:MAG TPA: aminotransferase class I/II-fold pyridoxal phosphate-dependent enzyme, partial [bacterium]|nr:aminotransferase class I/II-fold pyridoxal phosphate-dependent enzyme [bacterium]
SCVPPYNQEGARLGLESPLFGPANQQMVGAFQARRDVVVRALRTIDGIRCQMPRGAFYVFPNVQGVCEKLGVMEAYRRLPEQARALTTPSTLLQMFLLFEHQVATMDRKSFGRIGTEKMHYLRLSIATDMESLKTAAARISTAAADREGFQRFVGRGENLY